MEYFANKSRTLCPCGFLGKVCELCIYNENLFLKSYRHMGCKEAHQYDKLELYLRIKIMKKLKKRLK